MFLYPKAEDRIPPVVLHTPTAVESLPMVEDATGTPVITPVVVFKVPPVELFNTPRATEENPAVQIKLLRPKTTELIPHATLQ